MQDNFSTAELIFYVTVNLCLSLVSGVPHFFFKDYTSGVRVCQLLAGVRGVFFDARGASGRRATMTQSRDVTYHVTRRAAGRR